MGIDDPPFGNPGLLWGSPKSISLNEPFLVSKNPQRIEFERAPAANHQPLPPSHGRLCLVESCA